MTDLDLKHVLAYLLLAHNDLLHLCNDNPIMQSTARRNKWLNVQRPALALLIAECTIRRMQQRHLQTYDSFNLGTVRQLRDIYGQPTHDNKRVEGFELLNNTLQVFHCVSPAVNHVYSAAWRFTPSFESKLGQVIDLDSDHQQIRHFFKSHQPPADYDESTMLTLDGDAIIKATGIAEHLTTPQKLHAYAVGVFAVLNNGTYPQYYKQHSTNRLYTRGSHGLQNCKNEVRDVILEASGYNCYDMEVAAFSILMHFATDRTEYPAINAYILNRTDQRNQIAHDIGLDMNVIEEAKWVKTAITAQLFGAQLDNKRTTIQIPEAVRRRLSKHPIIKAIKSELNKLKNDCVKKKNLKTAELWQDRKDFEKVHREVAKEKGLKACHWKRDWMVWLYQSRERLALDAMRSILDDPNDCLLLHDAIYTQEKVSPVDFENAITKATGLNLKID